MKRLKKAIQGITLMEANEQKAAFASFLMVLILMAVYFTLRPVRDAMASDWSDTEVSMLWNIQFFISIGIVSIYSFAISRIAFKYLVPIVYSAFAFSFLSFYWFTPWVSDPTLIEKMFYVWVTAFSLLNLSVFWSFMSETFTQDQAKRLFAFIGAGASVGALVGPIIPTFFAESLGLSNLMLIAACGLFLVIPIIYYIYRLKQTELKSDNTLVTPIQKKLATPWWTGFRDTVRNPYLLAIAIFLLLYVFISSFIYFQQKNLLADFSRADRTQILGGIDWIVNILTFAFAFVITSRMVKKFGMGFTLSSVPMLLLIAFVILAFAPVIVILLAIQVTRRVGNYAITRPAREMLFTNVTQEERFKAKPVIDVVVYRGGDAVSGSLFALLSDGLGLGLMAISIVGAGIASLWSGAGLYLGHLYTSKQSPSTPSIKTIFLSPKSNQTT